MDKYLLDTNHASALVTPGHPLRLQFLLRLQGGDAFAICVPVVAETLFGIGLLPRAKQNLAEWARLRSSLTCYIPDEADAENAAALQRLLRRQGRQLKRLMPSLRWLRFGTTSSCSQPTTISRPCQI